MSTLRAIKTFLVIGSFVMTTLLLIACSARVVPAVVSNQTKLIPLGTTFLTTQSASSVFAVAWSHNGKRIVAITQTYCGDICAVVVAWDAATGQNVAFYPDFPIFAIAWSPDDTRLVNAVSFSDVQISQVS